MAGRVFLRRLETTSFRNLEDAGVEPDERFNLICGDNGQGKTALLEAIYVVATSKSFRAARPREAVRHDESLFTVRARIAEESDGLSPIDHEQVATFAKGSMHLRLDENPPDSLASYARRTPVVVFHPDELQLSTGPAALRRRLLDRMALHLSPGALRSASRYARAIRARHELLRRPSTPNSEIEAFETIAAEEGAALGRARADAADRFAPRLLEAFARIAAPDLSLVARYVPGGSLDDARMRDELFARRSGDARSKSATFGPHRDELAFELDGHPVRQVASQGQHRAIALSIKAGESATIAESAGKWPIQLLDDISSELDEARTQALFRFLEETRGQLFITGTREGLLTAALGGQKHKLFQIVKGAIREA
ncbi:MAG: DNA replication and repair protein RecF [Polyangiaceae bacterium]|nr:DNA replication and repair protein RecF [Polyangiaceae bacterium]